MDLDQFRNSLEGAEPPDGIPSALVALWWDAKGDWWKAHDSVHADLDEDSAWVHAYLHRKQGDTSNAAYWYDEAGKPLATHCLDEEWREITSSLLNGSGTTSH